MKKLESFALFQNLLKSLDTPYSQLITNCFYTPPQLRKLISEGNLFYGTSDGAWYLYKKETACVRLVYFVKKDKEICIENTGEPVLADLTIRNAAAPGAEKTGEEKPDEEKPDKKKPDKEKLWRAGFRYYKKYIRMTITREAYQRRPEAAGTWKGFCTGPLGEASYKEVNRLWMQCLDVFSTGLPDQETFAELSKNGNLLGIWDEQGELAGACQLTPQGRTTLLEHLVIHKDSQGSGMGKALLHYAFEKAFSERSYEKVVLWVDEENLRAISLYRYYGMQQDGLQSFQYIKNRERRKEEAYAYECAGISGACSEGVSGENRF